MKKMKEGLMAQWGLVMLLAFSMATSVFAQVEPTFAITEQPTAVTVVEKDSSVTLSFVAQMGDENVSYQWYSSADGSKKNAVALKGADESSFETGAISEKGVRYYFCVASVGEKSVTSDVAAVAYTGLPVLYVDTPKGVEITSKEDWTKKTNLKLKDAEDFEWNFNELTTSIRGRGNSTWQQPKKPYALKLNEKTEIMDMPKHKRWVLIANYLDNSFLKNHMAFYLSKKLGMKYTVRGEFVNLVFNGVYRGLYWLGEAIKVDKKRVNIYDGEDEMADTDDKDLLIEMDSHYDEVVKFTTPIRKMPYMIKNDDYFYDEDNDNAMTSGGTARLERFQNKIATLENLLYPDYETNNNCKVNTNNCSAPDESYADIIDVESWAKFWLINEIMDNTELNEPKSAYFTYQYKDEKEGRTHDEFKAGPVWDFDAGATTTDAPVRLDTSIYYNALFKSPKFIQTVKDLWNEFATMENILAVSNEIERMTAVLAVAAKLDGLRWGAHRDYVETKDFSFDGNVDFLKESVLNKMDVVNNFITKMVDLSTLTDDYEAKDGDILTGTLGGDYKISIEDGAKVTLKNATIQGTQDGAGEWAGITCNGNCNIMLEGVNTVKGFSGHYSGIHVPVGKTLTIDGSGKLSASSGSDVDEYRTALAAGIGGGSYRADASDMSCGNIVIKGGIITAAGGSIGGAGIGSGYYGISMERADEAATITIGKITISGGTVTATGGRYGGAGIGTGENYYGTVYLGDITISGGTVNATGGESAAGIGVGEFPFGTAHLGDVTITNGVKKVTVTKGNYECPGWLCAKHSIGIGYTSDLGCVSFGKITIGDKETEFIEESPFVYPTPIADFAAVQIYKYNNGITRAELDGNYGGESEDVAINIPGNTTVDKVEFTRSFPTGKFSTVVLPFDVNTSEVSGLDAVLRYNGIGKDKNGKDAIKMKIVWATDKWVKDNNIKDDKNNLMHYGAADLTANTPYMMQMSNPTFKVNNTAPIVLKQTAKAETDKDGWIFRGTWEYKKWAEGNPELGYAYGFAASASDDDKIQVGDFVRVGVGAWIRPMRAYLVKKEIPPKAQGVRANGAYVMRPSIVQEELPELMSVIIGGDEDSSEEQTTVIGHFNTRTGEFKMNRSAGARTFDLKGRYVGDKANRARGAYYGKRVLKK